MRYKKKLAEVISRKVIDAIRLEIHSKNQSKKLTRKEVAEQYRISLPTILKYEKEGKLKGYRLGGRVLFDREQIESSLIQRRFS